MADSDDGYLSILDGGFMSAEERELLQKLSITGGVVPYHCNRCAWGITVSVGGFGTLSKEMFARHRCENYPPIARPLLLARE